MSESIKGDDEGPDLGNDVVNDDKDVPPPAAVVDPPDDVDHHHDVDDDDDEEEEEDDDAKEPAAVVKRASEEEDETGTPDAKRPKLEETTTPKVAAHNPSSFLFPPGYPTAVGFPPLPYMAHPMAYMGMPGMLPSYQNTPLPLPPKSSKRQKQQQQQQQQMAGGSGEEPKTDDHNKDKTDGGPMSPSPSNLNNTMNNNNNNAANNNPNANNMMMPPHMMMPPYGFPGFMPMFGQTHPHARFPPNKPRAAGIILSMACDSDQLSEYQILVRRQLEIFEATQEDVESNTQGRKKPVVLGQVGLRCRHCASFPLRARGRGAVYYPAKLFGIYQAAQNMAGSHLCQACQQIPPHIKQELRKLRIRRDNASGGKQYWADGCRALGIYEDGTCLRLQKKPPPDGDEAADPTVEQTAPV